MGCGVVGSGVVEMLIENEKILTGTVGSELRVLYMLDLRDLTVPEGVILTKNFEDILTDERVQIVVETMGGTKFAYPYTKKCLEAGKHVITSNKELVADFGDELLSIAKAHGVSYLYEASTGGGIPIIRPIQQDLRANKLSEINGIVNGSTNYLLTEMREKGVSFPAALGEAKRLGYVEANPAADVEGWDARRKLAILANAAFGARLGDNQIIPTTGISAVTEGDMNAAAAFGGAVKLIAHAHLNESESTWTGWVHPCFVPSAHPLYNVNDVFNAIMVHGNFVDNVMFFGRGAGSKPTASAVVGDIVEAAQSLDAPRKRLEFASPVAFDAEPSAPRRLLVRFCGDEDAVKAVLPGCIIKDCGDEKAVMTAEAPADVLDSAIQTLSSAVQLGAPLYVL